MFFSGSASDGEGEEEGGEEDEEDGDGESIGGQFLLVNSEETITFYIIYMPLYFGKLILTNEVFEA